MKTKSLLFITALLPLSLSLAQHSAAQNPPQAKAVTEDAPLLTRAFIVMPDFLSRGKGGLVKTTPPADPFSNNKKAPPPPSPAQQVLQSLGVTFAEGTSATFDRSSSRLIVKNTAEQLDLVEKIVSDMNGGGAQPEGLVLLEVFSLPPLAARKALIAHPKEVDLYQWVDGELEKKDSGVRLERNSVTRVRSGQRSQTYAIDEYAYPTEFDPPQIPQVIGMTVGATGTAIPGTGKAFAPWPITATTPSAMNFRNIGWMAEIEMVFSQDQKTADLNFAPHYARLVGTVTHGLLGEILQPVIETQKCALQLSATIGQPALASTFSPPVGTGVPGGSTEDRVWLLFVTVNLPQ